MPFRGSCLCGAVTLRVDGAPLLSGYCQVLVWGGRNLGVSRRSSRPAGSR